jgi:hypothetical protein
VFRRFSLFVIALTAAALAPAPSVAQDQTPSDEAIALDTPPEAADGIAPDYLTPLASWAPSGAVLLKDAAVCHQVTFDWYALFAVFHVHRTGVDRDELYLIVSRRQGCVTPAVAPA